MPFPIYQSLIAKTDGFGPLLGFVIKHQTITLNVKVQEDAVTALWLQDHLTTARSDSYSIWWWNILTAYGAPMGAPL